MSELLKKVFLGVLRTFLAPLVVWLVNHEIITNNDSAQFIAEVSAYGLVAVWAAWSWMSAHRAQLVALAMSPGSTLKALANRLKDGHTVDLMTGATETPIVKEKQ